MLSKRIGHDEEMGLSIAHLSDPHLRVGPLAAEPTAGLHLALGRVLALDPRPDCVVITGDLADNGEPGAYATLRELVGRFPLPVHLATGNHDDPKNLLAEFGGSPFLGGATERCHYTVDYPDATVVVLDSWDITLGGNPGQLGPEQVAWLDAELARRPDVPAVLCLHHPPTTVGIPFLDGINLRDGAAMADVVSRHPHVVRVLAGHVHRNITAGFAGTVLTTAPSTYRQIGLTLREDRPIGYLADPTGFLLHLVSPAGTVTHYVPVSHVGGLIGGW
jgi:3',5'-cyclic AMP phosphodiesterase CpdA